MYYNKVAFSHSSLPIYEINALITLSIWASHTLSIWASHTFNLFVFVGLIVVNT